MDLSQLLGAFLNTDTVNGISQTTSSSADEVTSVLAAALPSLLNGAKAQADDAETSQAFMNAMLDHSKDDTDNVSDFMNNVDLKDGEKIVGHLLGNNVNATAENVSRATGVSTLQIIKILAAAAPLLMSLLGKQASQSGNATALTSTGTNSVATSLMSSLLGGKNSSSLLTTLVGAVLLSQLTGGSSGGLLSGLLGGGSNQAQQPSGGLLSSLLGGGAPQQTVQPSWRRASVTAAG